MTYRVVLMDDAKYDIIDICYYIAVHDSVEDSQFVYDRLQEATDRLETFPERGHGVPELESVREVTFREIHFKPYRIVYEIDRNTVFVHGVFDGRRDLKYVLQKRLLE